MLGLSSHLNFYLCEGAVDMRKGIVSLSELVRRKMKCSPETGDVFIFLGKDRRNLKILRYEMLTIINLKNQYPFWRYLLGNRLVAAFLEVYVKIGR